MGYAAIGTVIEDTIERRLALIESRKNLEEAKRMARRAAPVAATLVQHNQENHYIERLAQSYGK